MTVKFSGGPAFPRGALGEDCDQPYGQQAGMSLRDWFAGQAISGLLFAGNYADVPGGKRARSAALARDAYIIADAMVTESECDEPWAEGDDGTP